MKSVQVPGYETALPVTPGAGVWIEIELLPPTADGLTSLPVRECGLKSMVLLAHPNPIPSLPVRECGLKYLLEALDAEPVTVTPGAGVWIEISIQA